MPREMWPSEKIFADFLDSQGLDWEYEPKKFDLGDTKYIPDFYVPSQDIYYEVIGSQGAYNPHVKKGHFEKMATLFSDINLKIVYPDGQLFSSSSKTTKIGRKSFLKDPVSVRLLLEGKMVEVIDREVAKKPEATRSSIVRSVLRSWMAEIDGKDGKNAEENVSS